MPAPQLRGPAASPEDTSLGPPAARSRLPGRSASVTSQLSLHPSINRRTNPRRCRQSSPSVAVARRNRGAAMVPPGAALLHLPAGKAWLCRWWR